MTPSLTPAERRLVELLRELGAVDPEALERCAAEVVAGRAGGGADELGARLIAEGLLDARAAAELLGGDEDRARAGLPLSAGPEQPAIESGADSGEESAIGLRTPPRRSGRVSARLAGREPGATRRPAPDAVGGEGDALPAAPPASAGAQPGAGAPDRGTSQRATSQRDAGADADAAGAADARRPERARSGRKERQRSGRRGREQGGEAEDAAPARRSSGRHASGRQAERGARVRSGRRSSRAPVQLTPVQLTPPEAPAPGLPHDPDETSDLETRSFDPAALAAASVRPTSRLLVAPALVGGAALSLVLGLGVLAWSGRAPDGVGPPGGDVQLGQVGQHGGDDTVGDLEGLPGEGGLNLADGDLSGTDLAPESAAVDSAGVALAQVEEAARRLVEQEDYAGALALYADLPPEAARGPEATEAEGRLRALRDYRERVEQALEDGRREQGDGAADGDEPGPRGLRALRRHQEALARLEALVAVEAPLAGSPSWERVNQALIELTLARSSEGPGEAGEAGPAVDGDAPPGRAEPPQRVQRFRALAARGRSLAQAMGKAIAEEKQRLARAQAAEVERARQVTRDAPLDLELVPGYTLQGARITDLDELGFTLLAQGDELRYGWDAVEPRLALRIRALAAAADSGEDQLRLARWCLERRLFDEARQAFGRAVLLDPALKGRVPDVAAIARASRIFSGVLERRGTLIQVRYDFGRAAEANDWEPAQGVERVADVARGRLQLEGKGLFLAALQEVGFEDGLELELVPGPTARGAAPLVGVSFAAGTRDEVTYAVALDAAEVLLLRAPKGGALTVVARQAVRARAIDRLIVEVRGGQLRARHGARVLLEATLDAPWARTRVVLGGAARQGGAVTFDALTVRGYVRRDWLRKAFGEFDALLRGLLARSEDLTVFAAPAGSPAPEPLSAEDEYGLAGVTAESEAEYRKGRLKAALGTPLGQLAAAAAFAEAAERSPGFAAAHYRRALTLEALGRADLALEELALADAACPRFYEAMAERARLLAARGELDEALVLAERALAVRPDHAPALSARGLVRFHQGDLPGALADLELALALDPWDDDVRAFRANVRNVLRGPPWARTFTVETEHFVVKTDISARRCEEYARELESMRGFYAARFSGVERPAQEPGSEIPKAVVLIFDTREGFHSYADLTTDDRVESLLGCYLPRYRQLLLYEDKDDASRVETRRVLYHEAFHQFAGDLLPGLPYWLNEGYADYFSSARVEDGRVVRIGAALDGRLQDLRGYVSRRGRPLPFAGLLLETPAEFYSGPVAVKYAQAWSMVHFFSHGAEPALRERFRRYLEVLAVGGSAGDAARIAWDGVDWGAVQRAWWTHVKTL